MERSKVVAQMQSWIGKRESDGSHKSIVDIYNSVRPIPQGYKVKYTDSWCAVTVTAAFDACGYTKEFPARECSCPRMISLLQKYRIWVEDDGYIPKPGDIIFYDWQDSGSGDNMGTADHVGIVENVVGNDLYIIEGNYNNKVARRMIKVNARYIRGYGIPKYEDKEKYDFIYNGIDFSPVFNPEYYALNNPDVQNSPVFGKTPKTLFEHFIRYGISEGRKGCYNFDVDKYYANNPDLRYLMYEHYCRSGKDEPGRRAV